MNIQDNEEIRYSYIHYNSSVITKLILFKVAIKLPKPLTENRFGVVVDYIFFLHKW